MSSSLRTLRSGVLSAQPARSLRLVQASQTRALSGASTSWQQLHPTRRFDTRQQCSALTVAPSLRLLSSSAFRSASTPAAPVTQATTEKHNEEGPDPDQPPPKASLKERLKFLTKRYGWWALAVYLAASTVDLSLTFLAVHMLGADHIKGLEAQVRAKFGMEPRKDETDETGASSPQSSQTKSSGKSRIADSVGNANFWTEAVLAYTIHKTLLLPLRVAFTAAVTPSFVKWLVKMGWAKANHTVRAQVAAKAAQKAAAAAAKSP